MKTKVYLAGPFFTEKERKIVEEAARYFRDIHCFDVYVPMEHKIPNAEALPNHVWAREVFLNDVEAINNSDMVIVLEDRLTGDTGTAWECGYAYGIGKEIRVYKVQPDGVKSLMIVNSAQNRHCYVNEEQK